MNQRPAYKNFKEEIEERVTGKLFYKFIVALFVFYIILLVCAQSFYAHFSYVTISGKSMQNTLNANPVSVTNKNGTFDMQDGVYIRYTQNIDYNDIVIIKYELATQNDSIIKRTLALEGDYITIAKVDVPGVTGGEYRFMRVKKNTQKVEVLYENYIKSYTEWTSNSSHSSQIIVDNICYEREFYENFSYNFNYNTKTFKVEELGGQEVTFFEVPEGRFFFMGDNRHNSLDARANGTFKITDVIGKVIEIVPDGTPYKNNNKWWINRTIGFVKVCWKEVLRFFGANI